MTDEKLQKKLHIKPGMRALVLNAPDAFLAAVQPLPDGSLADIIPTGGRYDYLHLFAQNRDELAQFGPIALATAQPDALFWISYPKQSAGLDTDLNRDAGWALINDAGYRGIAQVSIDDTWSAVRFRPRGDDAPNALIAAQFAGPKAHLQPLYERLVAAALHIDPTIAIAPRKSYIALQKNKTFALIKASSKDRLDLGLKVPTYEADGRLQDAAGFGSGSITHKVALSSLADIDDELLAWLRAAYSTVI